MTNRSKAFFINGGAGRVLCSIPALEKYYEETKDEGFIIVCEGGSEFYKGHSILDSRAYEVMHKNLFQDKLKDMDIVSPEPYRIWEYYNQKASLAEAFDIAINNKGIRELPQPTLNLSRDELAQGAALIAEVKEKLKKEKVVVLQPFGRGIQDMAGNLIDPSGRSIEFPNVINIIKQLQKENWAVVFFSEVHFDAKKAGLNDDIAKPEGANLRLWSSIIASADLFIGCDSVGQHIAHTVSTPAISIIGSTFPVNVSYPETDKFKVMDLGEIARKYSPIRITMDEAADRNNERLMYMTPDIEKYLFELTRTISKKKNKTLPNTSKK